MLQLHPVFPGGLWNILMGIPLPEVFKGFAAASKPAIIPLLALGKAPLLTNYLEHLQRKHLQ